MKILLINHYAGSLEYGMEFRPFYLTREWVKSGHKVCVVAASFSHLRKKQPTINKHFHEESIAGGKYVWLRTPVYKTNSIKRFLNILAFVAQIFRFRSKFIQFNPDVVIASSTYPLDIFPAYYIHKKTNSKLVYEVHDLWPLSPMELGGMSKFHPFIVLMQAAENFACKQAQKTISILPKTKEHLQEHGMSPEKFCHIPNGIVKSDWTISKPIPIHYRKKIDELKQNGIFLVGYAGAHGIANALSHLIKAADIMKSSPVCFILVGNGQEKENLIKQAEKLGLANVDFWEPIEKLAIPDLLTEMDALYVSFQKQPLFRFGVSLNKMFDYMMSAKPIIFAIEAGNDPIQDSGAGISIKAENPEEVAKSIRMLMELTESQRKMMGENGRQFVLKHHEYKVLAEQAICFIKQ
jgi:glycosyltransferase involved in cell wall biosynthesis